MAANRYPLISTLVMCAAEAFEDGHMPTVTQFLCDQAVIHTVWLLEPEPIEDLSTRTMELLEQEFIEWRKENQTIGKRNPERADEQNKVLMVYCVMSMGDMLEECASGEAYDEIIESAAAMLRKVLML